MINQENAVSEASSLKSHFIEVLGSKLHYLDEGKGEPILFLHGAPASSYVWRHIIPKLKRHARCIAPDLIGFGQSDKPDIAYTLSDHIKYIDAFIAALGLKNITLVVHAWGSVIGLHYAARHPSNIKALAMVEAYMRPVASWDALSLPVQELASILKTPDGGFDAIMNKNYYFDKVLPNTMLRKLTLAEKAKYQEPFKGKGSCKPLWQYANEVPLGDNASPAHKIIEKYSKWLQETPIPKLILYSIPGYLTTIATLQWAREHLSNLEWADLGEALHYPHETVSEEFAKALSDWYLELKNQA